MSDFIITSLKKTLPRRRTQDSRLKTLQRVYRPIDLLTHRPIDLLCVLCLVSFAFFCPVAVQASVSGSTSYSYSFTNDTQFTIPAGMSVSLTASASISGTMTVTGPDGYSNTISVWGPGSSARTITLGGTGTYSVSESFHLKVSAEALGRSGQAEDDASSNWSFDNSISGGIATFHVSSSVSLSKSGSSGNVDLSVSGMSATITATSPIAPGDSASASVNINWSVDTSSPSIEVPPGTIEVYTNLLSATFTVDGYSGRGKFWRETVSAGEYTIIYGHVSDVYETPPSETKTLSPGGIITFTGRYRLIPSAGTGTIEVRTNLPEATFSLSSPEIDPEIYSGGGEFWTKTGVSAGEYTIIYDDVPGYKTPPSETAILTTRGTITFTGEYLGIGTIEVRTNLSEAVFDLSGPANYRGDGKSWTKTEAVAGEYTITYVYVSGYKEPPPEIKTLTPGGVVTFTGEYRPMGAIEVYTNLLEASFSLSGPASYSGSGRSWKEPKAPTGDYTITYDHVPGYGTPPSETQTLTTGGKITFLGGYKDTGTIEVHTNLPEATFSLSGPESYSGNGELWTNTEAVVGEYTITYGGVLGYKTPAPQRKTLTRGGTATFTGEYMGIGVIEVQTNLASASFSLSGPDSYSGTGKSWTKAEAPVGEYAITYDDVSGYGTPLSETKTLTPGGVLTFIGEYKGIGTIEVRTNQATATFNLSGPVSFSGSGESWAQTGAPTGEYIITYGDVPGYKTPLPEAKKLPLDGTVIFTGEYIGIGTIEVRTNLASATFNLSGPASYSGSGELWINTGAVVGEYTITYGDVLGYKTPSPETKTLTLGGTIDFTGKYTGIGVIEVQTNLATATFNLSGPASYSGNGESWIQPEAVAGEYTITYGIVPGYKRPPSEKRVLIGDGTISFTGTYTPTAILSVEVSGTPASVGDTIVVSMSGEPGGTATFSIISIESDIPMTEGASTPGLYTGKYVIREGMDATDVVVSVKLIGATGIESTNEDKTVTIDAVPPRIESVDVSGSPAKKAGDIITVKLVGEPGGVATFSIADIAQDIPMQESKDSPGTYEGSYAAVEGMNAKEAKVVVRLADAMGNAAADESKTASISTAPWDVNGDGVVNLLDIEAIGSNLGRSPTPELDLNDDGVIDALDLALVGIHYGEKYGRGGELLAAARPLSQETLAALTALYTGDPACRFCVFQNYPNPCNPGTWIPFVLAEDGEIVVTIYSNTGQLIRRLDLGYRPLGIHISKDRAAYWDGRNEFGEEVASGVYFYHMRSGGFSTVRKMLVSR